ncbi:MAG: hypothetical protein Q9179_002642 [Wetmoreana sp. 5 TL-2023]
MAMKPESMDLLRMTGNGQYPAMQARDMSLGVFFNFDLARLGQVSATPPWTDATDDVVISSSCYKHVCSTINSASHVVPSTDPLVVDPYRIQIVQIKGECLDADSTLDLSHQNRFHAATLQELNDKFASMREGDTVSATDKELWEYFATLYKHSNKGIKGRGKDRRISTAGEEEPSTQQELQSEEQLDNVDPYYGTLPTGAEQQGRRVGYPEDIYGDMRRTSAPSLECSVDPYSPTDGYD